MISPHITWLEHGKNAETALVGSVVVGRIAFDGDLWAWQASLPHGDLMADHGGCETERQAQEHVEAFLKLWLEPFQPLMAETSRRALISAEGHEADADDRKPETERNQAF